MRVHELLANVAYANREYDAENAQQSNRSHRFDVRHKSNGYETEEHVEQGKLSLDETGFDIRFRCQSCRLGFAYLIGHGLQFFSFAGIASVW